MPSGPKKRRAAKRKKEGKAQAKQSDVSEKLAKGGDLHEAKNTNEGVSDNSNAIQENNEAPLLDVTSNEDILESNDESALSKNACCMMEGVESGEILLGNESGGVETEKIMTSAPETLFELVSNMTAEQILEGYHYLGFDNDTIAVDYVVPVEAVHVEELSENEAANVVKEVNESKSVVGEVADMFRDASEVESVVLNNDDNEISKDATIMPQNPSSVIESVVSGESVPPSGCKEIQALTAGTVPPTMENQVAEIPSGSKETQALTTGTVSPAVDNQVAEIPSDSKEIQALPAGTVPPATENQVAEIPSNSKGMQALPRGTVPPATENQVTEIPSDSKEMLALPEGTVPPATESQVTEIPSDSKEMLALPEGTVPPATESQVTEIPSDSKEMLTLPEETVPPATANQVYFACPMHCKAECSFSQLLMGQFIEKVVQLKRAIHSLKEDVDELDSISC